MPLVDYVLLIPRDEEWRSIRNVLESNFNTKIKSKPIKTITYYLWKQPVKLSLSQIAGYLIVAAPMSRKTPGQSYAAVFSSNCLNQWKPNRIVLLGIAGSLEPDRIQLGDVVVAENIYGYEKGDIEGSKLHFRPTYKEIGALDLDRIRAFRDDPIDYPKWQKECLECATTVGLSKLIRFPELHIEHIASGNFVVKSVEFGQKLKDEINKEISAVEMECSGLYQALYLGGKHKNALMIRGISDYADENKKKLEKETKNAWRKFAAGNTARLLQAIWRRGPVPPISPNYQLNLEIGPYTRFRDEGVPNIEFKQIGAQDIVFSTLLKRSKPNPQLFLKVSVISESGNSLGNFHGQCIVESPDRQIISGKEISKGEMVFNLPASEWGLNVEMLLSFPCSFLKIKITCYDEFQRITKAYFEF